MMKITQGPTEYADRDEPGPLLGAIKAISGIEGTFTVNHMTQGCGSSVSYFLHGGPIPHGAFSVALPSGIHKPEIIFGENEEIILGALRRGVEVARGGARLGFVITNDATSMIQDDITRAATVFQQETGLPVIPIDTAGFYGGFNRGSEMIWDAVIDRFVKEPEEEKEGLNLVGPHLLGSKNWPNDILEIERLLQGCGVKLNLTLFRKTTVQELPHIARAQANYLLCGEAFPDFERRSQALGQRLWGQDVVLPLGVHNTIEWALQVAREFGDPEKAKAQLREDMDMVKRLLRGNVNAIWSFMGYNNKHPAVIGYAGFAAALARCLFYDFNMKPPVVALLAETPQALERAKKLLEPMADLLDFEVLENPSMYQYGEAINKARVDFAVGMPVDRVVTKSYELPHLSLGGFYHHNQYNFVPWPYLGIRGVLYLMGELWNVLEEVITEEDAIVQFRYRPRDEMEEKLSAQAHGLA